MATLAPSTRSTTIKLAADSAGPFLVGFRLFGPGEIIVHVDDVEAASFTLRASFDGGYDDNATISFNEKLPAGSRIVIDGLLTPARSADYLNGDPGLTRKLNTELARSWGAASEARRDISRSLRLTTSVSPLAPAANSLLGFDSLGEVMQYPVLPGDWQLNTIPVTFVGDGETTRFLLPFAPGGALNARVYLNGVRQNPADYAIDGVYIAFVTPVPQGVAVYAELARGTPLTTAEAVNVLMDDGKDLSAAFDALTKRVDAIGGEVVATLRVPSDYPTIQGALNAARNLRVPEGDLIEVMIEPGFRPAALTRMENGDFSHIRISSVAEFVVASDGFPIGTNGFEFVNCRAPIWNIRLDMNARGRNGIWLDNTHMRGLALHGADNAGGIGPEPRGCGIFGWKGSSLQCEPVNVNGVLVGWIAERNKVRGVDITHNSQASLVGARLVDNGSINDLSEGHCHVFVSRSSFVQIDNATFQGGVRAIRNARSIVTSRTAFFRDVAGECVRQFEGGFTIVAGSDYRRCGAPGYPMFYITGASESRPQGGGYICAESGLILEPKGEIAVAIGGNALISLEDSIADDLPERLARISTGGRVVAARIAGFPTSSEPDEPTPHVSAAPGYTATELVLASDASIFESMGGKLDANGARDVIRLSNGSSAHLRGASLIGFGQRPIRLDTLGCRAFLLNANLGTFSLPSVYSLEGEVLPEQFGAFGDGVRDDTAAVNAFLAYVLANGGDARWGHDKTYLVSDNVPLLHSVRHTGFAAMKRGGAVYHLGSCPWGAEQRIYVSQTTGLDTNDGLTSDRPLKLRTGFDLVKRLASGLPTAAWVIQALNDTYPSQAAMRLDQFPDTEYPITMKGYVDGANVPMAVFRGWDGNVFRRLTGKSGGNFVLENFKFTDSTGEQIVIQNGFNFFGKNLHADNIQNTAFRIRGGQADLRMITVKNGVNGVDLQGVYGSAGAGPDQLGVDGIVAENMTGAAVVISRGAISYVRRLTATNVGMGIDASRMCRVRMQNNVFNSWTIAAVRIDESVVLNNDFANPNIYPGAVFGRPVILTDNGATALLGGDVAPVRKPHLLAHGAASILTGTVRTDMAATTFSPFRMPGWWLMSPYAYGWVEYDFLFPVAERLKFEITGDHPSTSHILAEITFDVTGQGRGKLAFEFSGSVNGSSLGLYKASAITSASTPAYTFGSTKDLAASPYLTSRIDTLNKFRIYVTRSVGTGDLRLVRMASDVAS